MGEYNWEKIQLFNDAVKGLVAIEKLTGEKPAMAMVIVDKEARERWNEVGQMVENFYKLDMQERFYASGMAKRPVEK